jgi:hypothetical protein
MIEEAKLAMAGQPTGEQVIRIEGGLPELPGSSVIMPGQEHKLNGHRPVQIESVPSAAKASEP